MYFSFLHHVSFDGSISKSIKIVLTETLLKEKNCLNSVEKKSTLSLLLQNKNIIKLQIMEQDSPHKMLPFPFHKKCIEKEFTIILLYNFIYSLLSALHCSKHSEHIKIMPKLKF